MNSFNGLGDIDFIARTSTTGTNTRTAGTTNGLYDTSEDGNLTAIAGFTATDTRVVQTAYGSDVTALNNDFTAVKFFHKSYRIPCISTTDTRCLFRRVISRFGLIAAVHLADLAFSYNFTLTGSIQLILIAVAA